MSDLVLYNDFLAEMAEEFTESNDGLTKLYYNFDNKGGTFQPSTKTAETHPPMFDLVGVVIAAQSGQQLWPTGKESWSKGMTAEKPLCKTNDVKLIPESNVDGAWAEVLEPLGWTGVCSSCSLRQYNEGLGRSVCSPTVRIAVVAVDRKGTPLEADAVWVVTFKGVAAAGAAKRGVARLIEAGKGAPHLNIVKLTSEKQQSKRDASASSCVPKFTTVEPPSPDLRAHAEALIGPTWKFLKRVWKPKMEELPLSVVGDGEEVVDVPF